MSPSDHSSSGFLLVIGEILSNEQREELLHHLQQALKQVDLSQFEKLNDLFNNFIDENEFQPDCQYRRIANADNGLLVGFLYLPSFHTVVNVLEDYFNHCPKVCWIFCGQQTHSSGDLILSDSLFRSDHLFQLFQTNKSFHLQDLRVILPFVSKQWSTLFQQQLAQNLHRAQIDDVSKDISVEKYFGEKFYENFRRYVTNRSVNFDLYTKLIPKETSGTIAFDEPDLYVLYGQQGEASLFGVRGFVVLINGGFSRVPSYWNLIRGLQNLDSCILTHFDYDVLPGLQTILHRKTIPSSTDGRLCKPEIGAIFLNQTQRTKLPLIPRTSKSSLLNNFSENVEEFFRDVKQLNINTFDLVKHSATNKAAIEPINLYKKIAFGSLDLYVLHPTGSATEDEKICNDLQKIPINGHQPSATNIPMHHWYSSCSLLVWTPSVKSIKNKTVRILYTGACPQTLVFETLNRVRNLDCLCASQQAQAKERVARVNQVQSTSSNHNGSTQKPALSKPKVTPAAPKKIVPTKIQKKPSKPIPTASKIKPSPLKSVKSEKLQPKPAVKKPSSAPPKKAAPVWSASQDKKKPKNDISSKQVNSQTFTLEPKKKEPEPTKPEAKQETVEYQEPLLETAHEQEETDIQNESEATIVENGIDPEVSPEMPHEELEPVEDNQDDQMQDQMDRDSLLEDANDQMERQKSIDLSNDQAESSMNREKSASPIDEIDLETVVLDQHQSIEHDEDNDEMEIIHHEISDTEQEPKSREQEEEEEEEIHPQGLPIENKNSPKPSTLKKTNNGPNQASRSSTLKTNFNQDSLNKPKHSSSNDSIFHVDVAYIPYHGHENYVDSEFFRRIRARYYVLNAVDIPRRTLESLMDGKQQWNQNTEVILVPTFDGEQLRQFFILNKTRLGELNIHILPASTRCQVQYDGEESPAQRLRFNSNDTISAE